MVVTRVAAAAIIGALIVPACGDPDAPEAAPSATTTNEARESALTRAASRPGDTLDERTEQAGLAFDPPSASQRATVAKEAARDKIPPDLMPEREKAKTKLAVWIDDRPTKATPNAPAVRRLVWMVIRPSVPDYARPSGAYIPGESAEDRAKRNAPQTADILGLVDALSGEYIGVFVLGVGEG